MGGHLVFAADASLRFHEGRWIIDAAASPLPPFVTDHAGLAGWLLQFASATDPEAALIAVPVPARTLSANAIAYLRDTGALVSADGAANPAQLEAVHARSRQRLSAITRELYALACDVGGFGPFAEQVLEQRTGVGLETRLRTLQATIKSLRSSLAAERPPYLQRQLQSIGIDAAARELKLHVGCGPCLLDGWINLDVYPAPLATNVLWGLPFADGSVRHVFLSHLLEHLFYPNDVHAFLTELLRVLAPGGVVRIVVPDIEQCIEAYQQHDASFFASRRQHWGGGDGNPTRLEDFLAYAGAGPDPAYLFEAHKFGYDFETLARALERSGFVGIERSAYMSSRVPALQVDSHSEVANARYGDRHYSLFIEASKPGGELPA